MLFGQPDETLRTDEPLLRMLPAHQRFEAYRAPAAAVDDGLVVHAEQVLVQRSAQVLLQRQVLLGAQFQCRIEAQAAVAAAGLALPDGQAGVTEQGIEVEAVLRVLADADAGCQAQLGVAQNERRAQLVEDPLGGRLGMLPGAQGEHAELVAGEARQHVVLTEHRANALRRLLQCQVAAAVAEAVVDALEVVQVHHEHRQCLALLACGQHLGDHLGESAAVEKVGQRVVVGHGVELVLGQIERLALLAEALFGPARSNAGDDHQQGYQADRRGECALAGVAAEWRGVLHETGGDCQGQRVHPGVVHGDDCRTHHQAA